MIKRKKKLFSDLCDQKSPHDKVTFADFNKQKQGRNCSMKEWHKKH